MAKCSDPKRLKDFLKRNADLTETSKDAIENNDMMRLGGHYIREAMWAADELVKLINDKTITGDAP